MNNTITTTAAIEISNDNNEIEFPFYSMLLILWITTFSPGLRVIILFFFLTVISILYPITSSILLLKKYNHVVLKLKINLVEELHKLTKFQNKLTPCATPAATESDANNIPKLSCMLRILWITIFSPGLRVNIF